MSHDVQLVGCFVSLMSQYTPHCVSIPYIELVYSHLIFLLSGDQIAEIHFAIPFPLHFSSPNKSTDGFNFFLLMCHTTFSSTNCFCTFKEDRIILYILSLELPDTMSPSAEHGTQRY